MIELIPAIDMIDGKCVRLSAGDYACKKVYSDDPAEVASRLYDQGFRRLHVVDLDGAKARHCVNLHQLERITSYTQLTVDFGGGLTLTNGTESSGLTITKGDVTFSGRTVSIGAHSAPWTSGAALRAILTCKPLSTRAPPW